MLINRSESCVCVTHLTSEGVWIVLVGVGSEVKDDVLLELGVLDSIVVQLVVIH